MQLKRNFLFLAGLAAMVSSFPHSTLAQSQTSTCLAIADNGFGPRIEKASLNLAALQPDEVKIAYVGHSAFRLETPSGVSIVTDYNGSNGEGGVPTVVTMNHAHETHYTDYPAPEIQHVLRGWNESGQGPAQHQLQVEDVVIRNVATDLYSNGVLVEQDGNSIFIFEVSGLCIGHLGHLHHKLTEDHIARIGRLDILFMPVDGTYTMSQEGMIELAQQLRTSMVFPMHYFSTFSLQRFIAGMEGRFEPLLLAENDMTVSLKTLPQRPQVVVLSPF